MTRVTFVTLSALLASTGIMACAHGAGEILGCRELPMDGKIWQADRVEPPWVIFVGEQDQTLHISQDCIGQAPEGMVFLDRQRQPEIERRLSARIRSILERALASRNRRESF